MTFFRPEFDIKYFRELLGERNHWPSPPPIFVGTATPKFLVMYNKLNLAFKTWQHVFPSYKHVFPSYEHVFPAMNMFFSAMNMFFQAMNMFSPAMNMFFPAMNF